MTELPQEFAEAWINGSHTVLGRELQPYCLYHVLALQVLNSPAILGGRMSLEDLEKAVLVCDVPLPTNQQDAARYSNTVAHLFNVKSKTWFQKFQLKRWHKNNESRYLAELIKFHHYIRDYSTFPKIDNQLKGQGNSANHILARAGFYIYQTGASVEYTFSLPVGQLNHLCTYFSALNSGKITFLEEATTKIEKYAKLLEHLMREQTASAVDMSPR